MGIQMKSGQIIEASFVSAPVQRNTREENAVIKRDRSAGVGQVETSYPFLVDREPLPPEPFRHPAVGRPTSRCRRTACGHTVRPEGS